MSLAKENVLDIIKDQHKTLKKSIKVLKNENAPSRDKIESLSQFIDLLKMHSEAEEQTLYSLLVDFDDSEMVIRESEEEHHIAKQLMTELESASFKENWDSHAEAKAKVLAEMVEHHAMEEEIRTFKCAKENFSKQELESMGEQFLSICEGFETQLVPPLPKRKSSTQMPLR